MTRAWIFDLDDTLYLERDYVRSGFEAIGRWAADEFEIDGVATLAWELFEAGLRGTTISEAFKMLNRPLDPQMLARAVRTYRRHEPDIALCPDAVDFLSRVKTDPVGLITDGPPESQRAKIRVLGLDQVADPIVVTYQRGPTWHKPSQLAFEHVQSRLGLYPSQCVYIADNPAKDFTAPSALGWLTIRLVRSGGLHAAVPHRVSEVDLTYSTLSQLPLCRQA